MMRSRQTKSSGCRYEAKFFRAGTKKIAASAVDDFEDLDNWLDGVTPDMYMMQPILELASISSVGGAQPSISLSDLSKSTGMSGEDVLDTLDQCELFMEHLYGVRLFTDETSPAGFRFARNRPGKFTLSPRLIATCQDGGLLTRAKIGDVFSTNISDMLLWAMVQRACVDIPTNFLLPVLPQGTTRDAEIDGIVSRFAAVCPGLGADVYMCRQGVVGEAGLITGGMVSLSAGLLRPHCNKIIFCGYPDFALADEGFDVWDVDRYNPYLSSNHGRADREWMISNTPGVKIWFVDGPILDEQSHLFDILHADELRYLVA